MSLPWWERVIPSMGMMRAWRSEERFVWDERWEYDAMGYSLLFYVYCLLSKT